MAVLPNGGVYWYTDNSRWPGKRESGSLFEACLIGDLEFINKYINSRGNLNIISPNGYSAMHFAIASNQLEMIRLLFTKMARPHIPDSVGVSPLALAARYGHLEVIKLLISNGAIVPSVDRSGSTALHEAARLGQDHCLKYLLDVCTSERFRALLSHTIWIKNLASRNCYDEAVVQGMLETAQMILGYMKNDVGESLPLG